MWLGITSSCALAIRAQRSEIQLVQGIRAQERRPCGSILQIVGLHLDQQGLTASILSDNLHGYL
jgi:hypothetical protein